MDVCPSCGHAQTRPIVDLHRYYAEDYQFQLASPDEDDLYKVVDGHRVFRAQHQGDVARASLALGQAMRVLDYGCGKATTLRSMIKAEGGFQPFVFDVSEAYRTLWDEFIPADQQACFELPAEWYGSMDVVLSFFALEHTENPHGFLAQVARLLLPRGKIFLIVPNITNNISDFLVVDHVNHFSAASLHVLLRESGFGKITIDDGSYRGAFVVTAEKTEAGFEPYAAANAVSEHILRLQADAKILNDAATTIRSADDGASSADRTVIYGSGIYGLFIASHLAELSRFLGFLDQNPFRQKLRFLDRPVIAPERIPDEATIVFVGLNPSIARGIVAETPSLHARPRSFVYLAP